MFLRTSTPITHRGERKTPQEQKTPLQEQKIIGEQKHHAEKKNIQNTIQGTKLPGIDIHHSTEYQRQIIDLSVLFESISPPDWTSTTCLSIRQMLNQAFHPLFHCAQPLS